MVRALNFLYSFVLHFVISEGSGRHAYHLTSFSLVLKVIPLTQYSSILPLNHKLSLLKTLSLVVSLYSVLRYILMCVCVLVHMYVYICVITGVTFVV
jgi:hypothetical protein